MLLHVSLLIWCSLFVGYTSQQSDTCSPPQQANNNDVEDLEKALILIKPDGVQRGLVGRIMSRFEQKGFQLQAMKLEMAERSTLENHYEEHAGKSFYPSLIDYMMSGPVVPMVWQGNNIIQIARGMLGATDPVKSAPGTIRGDFGVSKQMNLLHVSDSVESAQREIQLWFQHPLDILQYPDAMQQWKKL